MPFTVKEAFESRDQEIGISGASYELVLIVRGTPDEKDNDDGAWDAANAASPVLHGKLSLLKQGVKTKLIAPQTWRAWVHYDLQQLGQDQSQFSFKTGGGQQHITNSRGTVGAYAPTGLTAPNSNGAIGDTGDDIEGCDIGVPAQSFSRTRIVAASNVTTGYIDLLSALTYSVNYYQFLGAAPGELLFTGATGNYRPDDQTFELNYEFEKQKNATDFKVGAITVKTKRGWDYLWVRYEQIQDTTANRMVRRPMAVYVEQVYPYLDQSVLFI